MAKTTLVQSFEVYAKKGGDCKYTNLWSSQIVRLRKQGFHVDEIFATALRGQHYCLVSWKDATSGPALRLWEITQKSV